MTDCGFDSCLEKVVCLSKTEKSSLLSSLEKGGNLYIRKGGNRPKNICVIVKDVKPIIVVKDKCIYFEMYLYVMGCNESNF